MRTWQAGDARVRTLVEVEFQFSGGEGSTILPQASPEALSGDAWLYPDFVAPDGQLKGSIHTFLVETPTARIVIDTCVGNAKQRAIPFYNMLATSYMEDFERTGWTRDSVTHVINTHLHFDHVGWNTMLVDGHWIPTFPNAQYIMTRAAFEYHTAASDDRAIIADSVAPVVDAGLVSLVEQDAEIIPGVRLRPSPGHAPGHVNVVIDTAGARVVITGDVMHHPCQVAHPEWSSELDFDKDVSRVSRLAFLNEFADTPALVLGTHFPDPAGGRIVRQNGRYVFDSSSVPSIAGH